MVGLRRPPAAVLLQARGLREARCPTSPTGAPEVSSDGKTVTVKIKPGIKYATAKKTPIDGQEVKAADVKYAFERALNPSVAQRLLRRRTSPRSWAPRTPRASRSPASRRPTTTTIVFKLDQPFGATVANALVHADHDPGAEVLRRRSSTPSNPNPYETHPDDAGVHGPVHDLRATQAGRSLKLVRNPHWDASTDFAARVPRRDRLDDQRRRERLRPPDLHRHEPGQRRHAGAGRGARLRDEGQGPDLVHAARQPLGLAEHAAQAVQRPQRPQGRVRGARPPRACSSRAAARSPATSRRTSCRRASPASRRPAATEGPGVDYLAKPEGDAALAAEYMKKAGFASGKYEGGPITMFSSSGLARQGGRARRGAGRSSRSASRSSSGRSTRAPSTKFCNSSRSRRRSTSASNYGLAAGLHRRRRDAQRELQRGGDRAGQQRQPVAAGRPEDQRGDERGGARSPTRPSARRRGATSTSCSSRTPRRSRGSGTRRRTSSPRTSRASSRSGTPPGTCRTCRSSK